MATRTGLLPSEFVSFVANPATEPFWAAAAEHRLVLPRCTNCATFRFPPAAFCWVCRASSAWSGWSTTATASSTRSP